MKILTEGWTDRQTDGHPQSIDWNSWSNLAKIQGRVSTKFSFNYYKTAKAVKFITFFNKIENLFSQHCQLDNQKSVEI